MLEVRVIRAQVLVVLVDFLIDRKIHVVEIDVGAVAPRLLALALAGLDSGQRREALVPGAVVRGVL